MHAKNAAIFFAILPLSLIADEWEELEKREIMYERMQQESARSLIASSEEPTPFYDKLPKGSSGLYVRGEYLYWIAREDGLEFAATGVPDTAPTVTAISKGSATNPRFQWESGARAGIGYFLPTDNWDVFLNWTWFHDHAKGSKSTNNQPSSPLLAVWAHPATGFGGALQNANARWRLHYNTIDLEFGRAIELGNFFLIRPFAGVRGAWIDQRFKINYTDLLSNALDITNKNNFNGGGFRSGFSSGFYFGSHFSITGKGAVSLIWGDFSIEQKQLTNSSLLGLSSFTPIINIKDHYASLKSAIELGLGLRWETSLSQESFHFMIDVGWEMQNWSDLNQMLRYTASRAGVPQFSGELLHEGGDLGIQGLTVGLRLDF